MIKTAKTMNRYLKILLSILFITTANFLFSQEICNNGIDDDGDGLIDLNDTEDCFCDSIITNEIPSLIPNPSFESYSCCPETFSSLDCANTWIQASQATSDYFNTCGFTGIAPLPFPDGNAAAGLICTDNYSEYIGACLNSTMQAGESYQIQFDLAFDVITDIGEHSPTYPVTLPPINYTIFGTSSCSDLPFASVGCPIGFGNWQVLGYVSVNPNDIHGTWGNYSITVTPTTNIRAIALGGPCDLPPGGEYNAGLGTKLPYFFIDNLILNESSLWGVPISATGEYCNNNLVLSVSTNAIETVQWYLDGVAIDGEFFNELDVSGNDYPIGTYTVMISDFFNCATGEITITSYDIDIYDIDDIFSCHEIYLPPITGYNLTGNQNYYTQPGGNGQIVTSPITQAMMVYAYDAYGICYDQEGFYVNPNNAPNVFDIPDLHYCGVYTLPTITGTNLSGNQHYYTGPNGTGSIVNSPVSVSQQIYIYDGNSECYDQESFNVTIHDIPSISEIEDIYGCNSIELPEIEGLFLTGNQNYYASPNGQGSIINPQINYSQIIYAYDANEFCSDNQEIRITIYQQLPTFAGENLFTCGNSIILEATPSIAGSSGTWTGPGVIESPNEAITLVSNSYGTYTYYWHETFETCEGNDSTIISFIESPNPFITTSVDTVCSNNYELHVENVSNSGFWTAFNANTNVVLNPAPLYLPSIYSPDITTTIGNFNGPKLDVLFVWTEQNQVQGNICSTTAEATISFVKQPIASVGAVDEAETCGMIFTGLNADMTGCEWAHVEWISPETSCIFGNCTLQHTSATLLNDGVFGDSAFVRIPFLLTINNYGCSDIDTMWVTFYDRPRANAGLDGAICGSEYNLGAIYEFDQSNNYTPTGIWSTQHDFMNIEFPNSDSTPVNTSEFGIFSFIFRENNTNLSSCFSTDTVTIEFLEIPIIDAGVNAIVCGHCTELNAISADFYGTWLPTPGASFTDYSLPNTQVCVPADGGEFIFTWIESNQAITSTLSCTSIDDVTYSFFKMPDANILTDESDTITCGYTFPRLRAENPGSGIEAYWYCESSGVDFGNPFSNNTWVDVSAYDCYNFYWIEQSGPENMPGFCNDTAGPINICFIQIPDANAGFDTLFCGLNGTLHAIPSVGTGVWTSPTNLNINILEPHNPNSQIASLIYNTDEETEDHFTLLWTEDNGYGCTDYEAIDVIFARIPDSEITIIPPKCFGEQATIAANDNNERQYSWNFYNGNIQNSITNENGGFYENFVQWNSTDTIHPISLIVTNQWGCQSPINIDTVAEPKIPRISLTIIADTCSLGKGGIIFQADTLNTFFWIDPTIGPANGTVITSINNLPTNTYPIQTSYLTANIENYSYYINTFGTANCIDTLFYEIPTIGMIKAEMSVSADIITSELVAPNAKVIFQNTSDYDDVRKRCEWHFGDGTTLKSCEELIEHVYTEANCYEPFLIVMNRDLPECRDTAFLDACITIDKASKLEIPNIFSPNGDGINDYFQVKAQTLKLFNGTVVNRWGVTIFEWTNWEDYEKGWDGKLSGGSKASSGVYYYIINAEGFDGEIYQSNGAFHLMRE